MNIEVCREDKYARRCLDVVDNKPILFIHATYSTLKYFLGKLFERCIDYRLSGVSHSDVREKLVREWFAIKQLI